MAECCKAGCGRTATHYLVVKVWARGFPKTSTPITSVIGMSFCKSHAEAEAVSKDLVGDDFFDVVDTMTRSAGRVPVDRASLELVPVRGDYGVALAEMSQGRARQ